MNPIKVTKLDHVVLRVADLDKSIHFYRDVLGFPEARINKKSGLHQYQAGGSMVDIVPMDSDMGRRDGYGPPEAGRNVDHFAFTVSEFDEEALVAYLQSHGVEPTRSGRRFGAEGYGPSIYMKDPDGNTVEIKGPSEKQD